MKYCFLLLLAAFFLFPAEGGRAGTPGHPFVHPGMVNSLRDLQFMKEKVKAGKEPWISLWNQLIRSPAASPDQEPHAVKVIVVGFYDKPDIGATDFRRDGSAAYTLALRYFVSGKKIYARKCIEILNDWSHTLDSVTDGNKKLLAGIGGVMFLNAAEIIRYACRDWRKKDQAAFQKMILTVWYPLLKDFMPGYNGNWDAAISQTMMCIGIFCDRKDIFARAYQHCLHGEGNGAINYYINPQGQCQESGRDQGHVQMGLGFLSTACQIAWNQGYDLFGAWSDRLATGYEYTSKYMLGGNVKYVQYVNFRGEPVFGDTISSKGRGHFAPIYERAYRHYHDVKGMDMPYTRRALQESRPEAYSTLFMPWASLMNEGYPAK